MAQQVSRRIYLGKIDGFDYYLITAGLLKVGGNAQSILLGNYIDRYDGEVWVGAFPLSGPLSLDDIKESDLPIDCHGYYAVSNIDEINNYLPQYKAAHDIAKKYLIL